MITNIVNQKRYIGISRHDTPDKRWKDHVQGSKSGTKTALREAIKKYGPSSFVLEVVACANDWDNLVELEKILISQHRTFRSLGEGYNMTLGGEGFVGAIRTPEWGAKIGAANSARVQKKESRDKIAASKLGKPLSAEHRAKISSFQRGRKRSPEFCQKLSQRRAGVKHSDQSREKMSRSHSGKKITDQTRAKMSLAHIGKPKNRRTYAEIIQDRIRDITWLKKGLDGQLSLMLQRKFDALMALGEIEHSEMVAEIQQTKYRKEQAA